MSNKKPSFSFIRNHLIEIATDLMKKKGFVVDFPEFSISETAENFSLPITDLTHLNWISIDNEDSKDLDQLTTVKKLSTGYHLFIAIADVTDFIPFESVIDQIARQNTTTVYTALKNFLMIPELFCYDKTSLLLNQVRKSYVVEMIVSEQGHFHLNGVYRAYVKNQARLVYEHVSDWIEGNRSFSFPKVIEEQIVIQNEMAKKIHEKRKKEGALLFKTLEGTCHFDEKTQFLLIQEKKQTVAHEIIENIMIATNVSLTHLLIEKKIPFIRRIVKKPKRWSRIVEIAKESGHELPSDPNRKALQSFLIEQKKRDPQHFPDLSLAVIKLIGRGEYDFSPPGEKSWGHFDLGFVDYAHTTAPNRRYADLTMQRLIKSMIEPIEPNPLDHKILKMIAIQCTLKEADSKKIERHLYKSFAGYFLMDRIGETFEAIVTGFSEKGTWIRLKTVPIEGRLIEFKQSFDVKDHLKVKLVSVDIDRGFIDFCQS